jgi:hypothetical protein
MEMRGYKFKLQIDTGIPRRARTGLSKSQTLDTQLPHTILFDTLLAQIQVAN